jgi:hypothetical protein
MNAFPLPKLLSASPRQQGRQSAAQMRSAPRQPLTVVTKPASLPSNPAHLLGYDAAAAVMWAHYKDKKELFITDIRLYREGIIATLMAGVPPDAAFEPYLRPVEGAGAGVQSAARARARAD